MNKTAAKFQKDLNKTVEVQFRMWPLMASEMPKNDSYKSISRKNEKQYFDGNIQYDMHIFKHLQSFKTIGMSMHLQM